MDLRLCQCLITLRCITPISLVASWGKTYCSFFICSHNGLWGRQDSRHARIQRTLPLNSGAGREADLGEEKTGTNPLTNAMRADPVGRAQKELIGLRENWDKQGLSNPPVPLVGKDPDKPSRDWLPSAEWINGGDVFDILRLQTDPYQYAPAIASVFEVISYPSNGEQADLNYAISSLPPSHDLLNDFPAGSVQWFQGARRFLTIRNGEEIDGWEEFVSDLHEWVVIYGNLRVRLRDVFDSALELEWPYLEYSLPEAKQEPIWSFPKAMAWVATRDYLALARLGHFRRAGEEDEAVATDGVCKYNTIALGWLHTVITYGHCDCGALRDFDLKAWKHCTCISLAWEELVRFRGGLSPDTPELVFNLQEGWLSMTWPDGADEIRFLRRDILDRWPAPATEAAVRLITEHSTANGEQECKAWLIERFAADPEKLRSKKDFRDEALVQFSGRLSERGFNLRVWPELAKEHGRDGAGAKRKS